jgi:hypothetical protein
MEVPRVTFSDMAHRTASRSAPEFRHYCAYGVAIRSELPLPLLEMRGPKEPGLFELEIRVSHEPLSDAIPEGVTLQRNPLSGFDFGQFPDGSSYVRGDDVGEVLISKNGRSIACRPFRQTDAESFHVYLLGQALSFALVKGGFEPLHATAVVVEDQAVAFLGDCGFGKSTLGAAFLQAGHRLLADDLLLLRATTRGMLAYAGPARIKLFPEIAQNFLGEASSGVPLNPKTQKLIIPLEKDWVCADAVPLAAIYVLAPPDEVAGRDIRIVSISQREAFVTLLGSTFNYVISDPDRLRRLFKATQALADATIVRKLRYPRSLESLPLVREAILADLCAHKSEIATCKG